MVSLALKFLKEFWPYIAGIGLLVAAYLYVDSQGYERAELKKNVEIAQIEKAAAQSELNAWKEKDKVEQYYAEKAKKTDDDWKRTLSQYNANLLRYAQAGAGKAGPSSSSKLSSSSNGPGTDPKLPYERVEISYEDAGICSQNTARLVTVRNWALSILADQSKDLTKQPNATDTNSSGSTQESGSE